MLISHSTGMPHVDVADAFRRARRTQAATRAARWLAGRRRSRHPLTLPDAIVPVRGTRLEVIPLREIVGTVEATAHFDARFRPASDLVRARWERIALAHHKGVALPPITVLQRHDGYYVVDGRHRVSVALALGHTDIDARVTRVAAPATGDRRPCYADAA